MPLKLYLFGPPRVMRNDEPLAINLRKALALFAYLAMNRQAHSRDALATLFWPEKNQQTARANLRRTLYDLNQLLAEPLLEIEAETIALNTGAGLWLDSQHFEAILAANLSTPLHQDVEIDGERVRQLVAAVENRVANPATEHHPQRGVEDQVIHLLPLHHRPRTPCTARGQPPRKREAGQVREAVPVNLQRPQGEGDRVYFGIRQHVDSVKIQ